MVDWADLAVPNIYSTILVRKLLLNVKKLALEIFSTLIQKNLGLNKLLKNTKRENTRMVSFDELTDLKKKTISNIPTSSDPFRIQEHWRTKFKFYNECCICGETQEVALPQY